MDFSFVLIKEGYEKSKTNITLNYKMLKLLL